jgi:nuclear transport factor 2 (NTF2) superfamily protein
MNCEWHEDSDGIWHTACGNAFQFTTDGPIENRMKFCCYCGAAIEERKYDDEGGNQ